MDISTSKLLLVDDEGDKEASLTARAYGLVHLASNAAVTNSGVCGASGGP